MTERPKTLTFTAGNTRETSNHPNALGVIDARTYLVEIESHPFVLRIGTPEYIKTVHLYNDQVVDPDSRVPDNILPVPDVSNPGAILTRLSEIDANVIRDYLEKLED